MSKIVKIKLDNPYPKSTTIVAKVEGKTFLKDTIIEVPEYYSCFIVQKDKILGPFEWTFKLNSEKVKGLKIGLFKRVKCEIYYARLGQFTYIHLLLNHPVVYPVLSFEEHYDVTKFYKTQATFKVCGEYKLVDFETFLKEIIRKKNITLFNEDDFGVLLNNDIHTSFSYWFTGVDIHGRHDGKFLTIRQRATLPEDYSRFFDKLEKSITKSLLSQFGFKVSAAVKGVDD